MLQIDNPNFINRSGLKPQVVFEGKAPRGLKAKSRLRRDEQAISNRIATQPPGTAGDFKHVCVKLV